MNKLYFFFTFLLFISSGNFLTGQSLNDYRSNGSGNWSLPGSWQRYDGSSWVAAGEYPGQTAGNANLVTIRNTHTITLNVSPNVISSLNVGEGTSGILQYESATNRSLSVSGDVTIASGASLIAQNAGSQAGTLTVGGTLSNSGTLNFRQTAARYVDLVLNGSSVSGNGNYTLRNFTIGGSVTNSSTSTIAIYGDLTCNNSLSCSAGAFNFLLGAAQNINGTTNPTFNNLNISTNGTNLTLGGSTTGINVNGNFTMAGTSTFTFGTAARTVDVNGTFTGITVTMQGAGLAHVLNLGGAANTCTTFNTTAASGSTVNYDAAGAQNIFTSVNYRNLTISGSGVKTIQAAITINNNLTVNAGCTFAFDAGAARVVTVSGNLSGTGTVDMSGGSRTHTLNLNGSTNTIGTLTTAAVASTVSYGLNGAQTVFGSPNYRNLTLTAGGVKTIEADLTVGGNLVISTNTTNAVLGDALTSFSVVGTFTMSNASLFTFSSATTQTVDVDGNFTGITVNIQGAGLPHILRLAGGTNTCTTFNTTAGSGSVVEYDAAVAQTIFGSANYRYLTIKGAGIKSLGAAVTVNNDLVVESGSINTVGVNLTVSGTSLFTGAFTDNNNGGTNTFSGLVTVDAAGSFSTANNSAFIFSGGITNDGTFSKTGTGAVTLNAVQTITNNNGTMTIGGAITNSADLVLSGAQPITFPSTFAISGAVTVTNQNTGIVTVTGNMTGSVAGSTWMNDINSTLNYGGGTQPLPTSTLDADQSPNLVNYNANAAQGVKGTTYHNLTLSIGNTKTMQAATVVNNDLNIAAGTFSLSTFQLTLKGGYTNSATITANGATAKIVLNGTSAQNFTIGTYTGPAVTFFEINNAAGVTLGSSLIVSGGVGALTLTDGLLYLGNNNLTLTNSASTVAGIPSQTAMVVTNGTGQLMRYFTNAGNPAAFSFPVGDTTATIDYTPVTLDFSANSVNNRQIGVRVTDNDHPNDGGTTDRISRFWTFTASGAGTYTYQMLATYVPADVNGTETFMKFNKWDNGGSGWFEDAASSAAANLLSSSAALTQATCPLNNNDFTGRTNAPLYFRSKNSGNWNAVGANQTWEMSTDPAFVAPAPVDATFYPTAATSVGILIQNGHTVTLPVSLDADDFTIAAGGQLTINSGQTLTVANGASATDMTVEGTVSNSGIITPTGVLAFNSGSNYIHARDGGAIPTATWNVNATCTITGFTATTPTQMGQTFGNMTFDFAGSMNLNSALNADGNFTIQNGTVNSLAFAVNVAGNWTNNGTFNPGTGTVTFDGPGAQALDNGPANAFNHIIVNKAGGTISLTNNDIDINGNLTIQNNTLDANGRNIYIAGNWNCTGVFNPGTGTVIFDGAANSTYSNIAVTPVSLFSENWDNAGSPGTPENAGWIMGSITNHSDFRLQNGVGANLPLTGTYDCATYNNNTGTGYTYCNGCINHYIDLQIPVDLKNYNTATLSFWYRKSGTGTSWSYVFVDATEISDISTNRANWFQVTANLNAYCGDVHMLTFRYFLTSTATASNPGLALDNIVITGTRNVGEFNNIRISKTGSSDLIMNSSMQVNGNITIDADAELNSNGKNISLYGNFENNGSYTAGTSKIYLIGNSNQTISGSSHTSFYDLTKDSPFDLIIGDNLMANRIISVTNSFNWENRSDKIIVGNGIKATFIIEDNLIINELCELETRNASTVSIGKDFIDKGTFTHNDGLIRFHGNSNSFIERTPGGIILDEGFETDPALSGWTLNAPGSTQTNNSWRWSQGKQLAGSYDVAIWDAANGNWPYDYPWNGVGSGYSDITRTIDLSAYSSATLAFYWRCGGADSLNTTRSGDHGRVVVTTSLGTDTIMTERLWNSVTYKQKKISLNDFCGTSITLKFRFYNDGQWPAASSPGFCIDSVIIYSGSDGDQEFYDLEVDKDNNSIYTTLQCNMDVVNDMNLTSGIFDAAAISFPVGGNWTNTLGAIFKPRGDTVYMNNITRDQTIDCGNTSFAHLYIDKPGFNLELQNNRLAVDSNLTITTNSTLTSNGNNIELGQNWNNNGTFSHGNNTVKLNRRSVINNMGTAAGKTFYNVELDGESASMTSDMNVENNFIITSGQWDVTSGNHKLFVGNNWSNDGTFLANSGTVEFYGHNSTCYNNTGATQLTVYGGKPNNNSGAGGAYSNVVGYLTFDCFTPFTIVSVKVYAQNAGNRTFYWANSMGVVQQSVTVNVPAGTQRVTLNFNIPAGINHRLGVSGFAMGTRFFRTTSGLVLSYPYSIGSVGSVKSCSMGANVYAYLYDWQCQYLGSSGEFYNVIINKSGSGDELQLASKLSVNNNITMTRGDLNLFGDTLLLGNTATILSETNGNRIKATDGLGIDGNGDGIILTTRNINASVLNLGGMGIDIHPQGNMGSTVIKRGHHYQDGSGTFVGNQSVFRYFTLEPTNYFNDSVKIYYFADELNGHTDGDLITYQRYQDNLANEFWTPLASVNVSPAVTSEPTKTNGLNYIKLTLGSLSIPLPVVLKEFYTDCDDGKVLLKWTTLTEINNDYFLIEKSENGVDYSVIGLVYGQGTTDTETAYFYTDNESNTTPVYYRLKQIDYDGMSKYSDVVYSDCTEKEQQDFTYNISGGMLYLSFYAMEGEQYTVQIFDNVGRQLSYEKSVSNGDLTVCRIPVDKFKSGIYHLVVSTASNMYSKKIPVSN